MEIRRFDFLDNFLVVFIDYEFCCQAKVFLCNSPTCEPVLVQEATFPGGIPSKVTIISTDPAKKKVAFAFLHEDDSSVVVRSMSIDGQGMFR